MARSGPIEAAVVRSLRDAPILKRDHSTAVLAQRYAHLIDEAAALAALAAAALEDVDPEDVPLRLRLQRIERAFEAYEVARELGPKLLAALAALGMTPASRTGKDGGTGGPVVGGELAELRARAQQRRRAREH